MTITAVDIVVAGGDTAGATVVGDTVDGDTVDGAAAAGVEDISAAGGNGVAGKPC